ncbi:MAG: ABC transporter ATP-binding protein [Spirochaetales bacterium]|nr:ABC transporter ATP-binding protein [Spirochaetales bacterium]
MKTIFQYLKPYWFFAITAPLMMLLEVFMDLMLPATMAKIVDEGIASGNLNLVLNLGVRMIIFTLIAFVGGSGCSILSSRASSGLGADLRRDLFGRVLSLSHRNLDELETGNLITRLTNDVAQLEEVSLLMLRIMVRAPLQIVGSLVMAIIISLKLSSLFIFFVPALLVVMAILLKVAYPLFFKVQEKLDRVNIRLQENLAGKRLVKAFVREDYETEKFAAANDELSRTTTRANRTAMSANPIMQVILNGGIIAALWFGAELIDLGALKIGALIAFINYLRQLLFSLMMFSQLIMRVSRAQASSVRIQEVLKSKPYLDDSGKEKGADESKGALEFRNVSFSYRKKGDPVLKNLSFTVNPGETLAVIGATGSGKSSLVNLIPRFYDLDEGEILLDGKNIADFPLGDLRHQVAVVPQKTLLFSGTVRENILFHYPKAEQGDRESLMKKTAAEADIAQFVEGLPEGYDTDINQRGVNLSGGQKQRIAIARALAKEAPVVVLDDATSAVDTATERQIRRALKSGQADRTLIIVAQRISGVMDADRILVLEDGQISASGTHEELLETSPLYNEIYHTQIDEEALA